MRSVVAGTLLVLASMFTASPALAISCHCFQDRSYDATRPSAADSYFLATTQNSLIAAALMVSKRNLVQAKMAGADADLLWVAYYVADRTGLEMTDLLKALTGGGVQAVFSKIDQFRMEFDAPFIRVLSPQADLATLAEGAYRSVMGRQLGVRMETIDHLELSGADRQQQILAIFLSQILAENPVDIFGLVKEGKQSWGEVLASTGLDPQQIESTWQKLLVLYRQGN